MNQTPMFQQMATALSQVMHIASTAGLNEHEIEQIQIVLPDTLVDELWQTADRETLAFSLDHARESKLAGIRVLRASQQHQRRGTKALMERMLGPLQMAALDAWIEAQPSMKMSRTDAVRLAIDDWLTGKGLLSIPPDGP
ncbi:MAG: hypothetical protein JWL86_3477 [Rhizobium sp.]|nr:hypothetical protein [Rhizobium sp.]